MKAKSTQTVLIGHTSSWVDVNAGVLQISIFGPLLFLIYVNNLTDRLLSNAKLIADVTYCFLLTSADELDSDLIKINKYRYQ